MKIPDRYKKEGQLSQGGQGRVYKYYDNNLERFVAIKILHSHIGKESIISEVEIRQSLSSKHVASLYDFRIINKDDPIIIMEFVEGPSLDDPSLYPISPERLIKIIYQIASGILDFHSANIVHRDIKPNNIKYNSDGIIKIFDLGFSSEITQDAQTFGGRGTFGFAAPELFCPGAKITKALDIYAFGATLWYLAHGNLPNSLIEKPPQSQTKIISLNSILTDYPDFLINELDKCLAINPDERPTIESIHAKLFAYLTKDQHQATLVGLQNGIRYINSGNRTMFLKYGDIGIIKIHYDGYSFYVSEFAGEVYCNNNSIALNQALPSSCVITFGNPERTWSRAHLDFNISKPEVVI